MATKKTSSIDTSRLSEGTKAAIASLVDYMIDEQYGRPDRAGMAGARMIAVAGLAFDLGVSAEDVQLYYLRTLIEQGMQDRRCQCDKIHGNGCPHRSVTGQLFCNIPYESDVPGIDGAYLCGNCHITEWQSRNKE